MQESRAIRFNQPMNISFNTAFNKRKGRMTIASKQFGKAVLSGLIVIFLIAIVSSVIFAFILKVTNVKESGIQMFVTAVSFISLFIGGFISGGKGEEKGWMLGGATGLIYAVIIFLYQYLGYDKVFNAEQLIYYTCYTLVAMMGGILGVNVTTRTRTV
jgi:putative membrane protein (TIGR04086 family)